MRRRRKREGFTLIELMIVVAIIGILAAIAIPKFADLLRKTNEGSSKGNMGQLKSALTIYYGDMEGLYPANLASLTAGGRYINKIPTAKTPPYHPDSPGISEGNPDLGEINFDLGGWAYGNTLNAGYYGSVHVNCTHTDMKGSSWLSY